MRSSQLKNAEKRIGVHFSDPELLNIALLHSSAQSEESNERLEFLGDAVLSLIVTDYLYTRYPFKTEGELTKLRSKLVNTGILFEVAKLLKIDECLILGKAEKKMEGKTILSDAYEALIGAIYLDSGLEGAQKFIHRTLLDRLDDLELGEDYKSELQEKVVRKFKEYPHYRLLSEKGPQHNKLFEVQVLIRGKRYGLGTGRSKKDAEQKAAKVALKKLL